MNNISGVVRIPNYIKENYPEFTQFVTDFYEHMEEDNGFLNALLNYHDNKEAFNETDVYIDKLLHSLGFDVGQEIACSKKLLVSSLRDFYLSRGSEKSFVFLFRALYNTTPKISYPREKLLIPSEASYGYSQYVLLTASEANTKTLNKFLESGFFTLEIKGRVSGVSAAIEDVKQIMYKGVSCLFVTVNDVNGLFVPNELVDITDGANTITETIYNSCNLTIMDGGHGYLEKEIVKIDSSNGYAKILSCSDGSVDNVDIVVGGSGYQRNQTIISDDTGDGGGFFAVIDDVDVYGSITSVRIIDKGYGFKTLPVLKIKGTGTGAVIKSVSTSIGKIKTIQIIEPFFDTYTGNVGIDTKNGSGAVFQLDTAKCVFVKQGKHLTKTGFLGIAADIQDSLYKQMFSYVVSSSVSNDSYSQVVNDYVHPVGYIRFGVYNLESGQLQPINLSMYDRFVTIENIYGTSTFNDFYSSDFGLAIVLPSTNYSFMWPINNIDFYKFSNLFTWSLNDFMNDTIVSMTSEIPDNRTIDPEISIL